jgi:hypothetical protein
MWENDHDEEAEGCVHRKHAYHPITPKQRKKPHKLMKKRLEMRHKKYPEVRGKVVDYISHSIDDGTLCMNVCFKDRTIFSLRYTCDIFVVGADISDWKTGNYDIIRTLFELCELVDVCSTEFPTRLKIG